jgi:hypothetical protein
MIYRQEKLFKKLIIENSTLLLKKKDYIHFFFSSHIFVLALAKMVVLNCYNYYNLNLY